MSALSGEAAPANRPARVCAALDARLFESSRWFAIDEHNNRVPAVVVANLESGLRLVGQGAVSTIVGHLRPTFRVVDIDLAGHRGHAITEAIAAWCRAEDLWHLVRPSGGRDGRCHVFLATPPDLGRLELFLAQLRTAYGVTRAIDLRTAVRPLSAPHRNGTQTRPLGTLTDALAALPRDTAAAVGQPRPAPRRAVALTPRPRRLVDLDQTWAAYLAAGITPAIGGADHTRSTVEAIATLKLLHAGHTAESAWALIAESHPDAMTRAKDDRRRWILWVWNPAVRRDNEHAASREPSPTTEAVQAARARLWAFQWALSPRQRASVLLVGHHLLDRVERTGTLRVPVPERDLVLDTGLRDRKSIRAALRHLHGHLGVLHTDTVDPSRPDSSSFEFEIRPVGPPPTDALVLRGLREIPPPGTHTPTPPGTWATLPRSAHALWRTLAPDQGRPLSEVCQLAGLTDSPTQEPTASQLRTATTALTALAAAGLATCSADGQWSRTDAPTAVHAAAAQHAYTELHDQVSAERDSYRETGSSSWMRERAQVLRANRARIDRWWDSLPAHERQQRRTHWETAFTQLGVLAQAQFKATQADRRRRAGLDEATRHDAWITSHNPDAYVERIIDRQRWFDTLAPPLQQAHATAWQSHRDRYAVPRGSTAHWTRLEHAELLPSGRRSRDRAFLERNRDQAQQALDLTG